MTEWYINHKSRHSQPDGKYDLFRDGSPELIGTTMEHAYGAMFQYGSPDDWCQESMSPEWQGCTLRELWLQRYAMEATFAERVSHSKAVELIDAGPDAVAAFFGVDFIK